MIFRGNNFENTIGTAVNIMLISRFPNLKSLPLIPAKIPSIIKDENRTAPQIMNIFITDRPFIAFTVIDKRIPKGMKIMA